MQAYQFLTDVFVNTFEVSRPIAGAASGVLVSTLLLHCLVQQPNNAVELKKPRAHLLWLTFSFDTLVLVQAGPFGWLVCYPIEVCEGEHSKFFS